MSRHSQQIFKAHRVPNSLNPRDRAMVQTDQVSVFIVFKGGEACELTTPELDPNNHSPGHRGD